MMAWSALHILIATMDTLARVSGFLNSDIPLKYPYKVFSFQKSCFNNNVENADTID
ncbi:hypothetical protein PR003_g17086 [Phytophthora rubi]|uniref:Uncharacterized protein n=2 Tax=Phytophthora TaxID=4783 RepID=A0A6A3NNN9_9STRA|nr:hypothetical protein PR001_g16149 [Phytophthora rubi]KAE9046175.1 hypothetical protein PR002_g1835 [Phytophthora rubi]KAE9271033.1 hypothetical protein PF001_g28557 [Phytophthora fragariae]KAE9322960.1 hypothetical protein PR003_g17086 [Phytophthora rubi]